MNRFRQTVHLGPVVVALVLSACSNSNGGSGDTDGVGFSLALSAPTLEVSQGGGGSLQVTVNTQGELSEAVALSLTGDTQGLTMSFTPDSTQTESELALTVYTDAAMGTRELSVQGRSSGQTASVSLSLVVQAGTQNPATVERYSSKQGEFVTIKVGGTEFTYELIDGLAIYQGDMILGTPEDVVELLSEKSGVTSQGLGLARTSRRWAGGVVPYEIDESSYTGDQLRQLRLDIAETAEHFATNTSIRLVPRRGQSDYIRIENTSDPRICGSSALGRQGGEQTLFMSCGFGTLVHELNHALGVGHEQSRDDRNGFVTINFSNLAATDLAYNFSQDTSLFFDAGSYDYDSIMHYPAFIPSWSRNPSLPLITPTDPSVPLGRLGQRGGLSLTDRTTLCELYPLASAEILGPRNGSSFAVGESVELYGRYTLRGVEEPTQMRWSSSLDGALRNTEFPRGDRIRISTLSPGTHTITLEALQGCPGVSDTITITLTVSRERSLNIVSPADGSSFARGAVNIPFRADTTGFPARPSVRWESSLDGVLGESTDEISRSNLSIGTHTITATAASGSTTLSDSVNITVTGSALQVELLEPTGTEPFCADEPVTFRASVYDPSERSYENVPDANIVWRLERTIIGTGREFSRSFAVTGGDITVAATNTAGSSGTDAIYFLTQACTNNAPEVAITAPAEDSGVNDNAFAYDGFDEEKGMWYTDVSLAGSATDTEDGTLPGSALIWTTNQSELQAATLGSGSSLTTRLYSNVCTGKQHEITLTATDSAGNVRTALRRITIWTLC